MPPVIRLLCGRLHYARLGKRAAEQKRIELAQRAAAEWPGTVRQRAPEPDTGIDAAYPPAAKTAQGHPSRGMHGADVVPRIAQARTRCAGHPAGSGGESETLSFLRRVGVGITFPPVCTDEGRELYCLAEVAEKPPNDVDLTQQGRVGHGVAVNVEALLSAKKEVSEVDVQQPACQQLLVMKGGMYEEDPPRINSLRERLHPG